MGEAAEALRLAVAGSDDHEHAAAWHIVFSLAAAAAAAAAQA